ncbi:MAG: hypothetical protein ACRDD7_07465 [Peptostreptococcaceae bacterium]
MTEKSEDVGKIQNYISNRIQNTLYGYSSLSYEDKNDIVIELVANWILWEMKLRNQHEK